MSLARIYQITIVMVFLVALACNNSDEEKTPYSDHAPDVTTPGIPRKDSVIIDSAEISEDVLINP